MFHFTKKPANKLKAAIFIFGGAFTAYAIPWVAVTYQQKKAGVW